MTGNRLLVAAVVGIVSLTGCGGDADPAAAPTSSASPSPSLDKWAKQTCEYLGQQDPGNGYANEFAVAMAEMSTTVELVDLAAKAKQVGNTNLIRAWCQRVYPQSGATPGEPASS